MGMFDWQEKSADVLAQGGVIGPHERLPWPQTAVMGVQHVIAMFGATVLAPILMGFDPNLAILMSGIGTLIFFLITGGKVPSYLGSSFAFIGVVIAATAYAGKGPNANIGVALGGIIACGLVYTLIGAIVQMVGTGWIERFMPPVVTGSVVAVIGLNLAGIPIKNMAASNFDSWMQAVTFVCVGLVAVLTRGMVQRLLILVGLIVASLIYALLTNGMGLGKPLDLTTLANAPWFGMPGFAAPVFSGPAMLLIAPVAIILVAENLGHIKAVTAMTGQNLDQYMGRAFIGDGIATMVSGGAGGTGVTTYAENIGVMAATKIYSTAMFVVAALIAVLLGFSPKFGAVIQAIPLAVMGGVGLRGVCWLLLMLFHLDISKSSLARWLQETAAQLPDKEQVISPVAFLLGERHLVTVRHHSPRSFETFGARADKTASGCGSAAHVFLGLVEEILGRQADLLEGVSRALDQSARTVFQGDSAQKPAVLEKALTTVGVQGELLSRIRLGLMTMERALAYYAQSLDERPEGKLLRAQAKARMRDLQALEVHADFLSTRLSFATDATLGMVNLSQNVTVRIVSVVAVLFLPPTLIASIYGMNFDYMPELHWHYGYYFAVGLILVLCFTLYFRLKKAGWL